MNCRQIQSLIIDYFADDLARRDRQQIDEHLAVCSQCRLMITEERKLLGALRTGSVPDPGDIYWESLEHGILDRVTAQPAPPEISEPPFKPRRNEILYRYLVPLAALLILLIVPLTMIRTETAPNYLAANESGRYYDPLLIGNYSGMTVRKGSEQIPGQDNDAGRIFLAAPGLACQNMVLISRLGRLGLGDY